MANIPGSKYIPPPVHGSQIPNSPFTIHRLHSLILNLGLDFQMCDVTRDTLAQYDKITNVIPEVMASDNAEIRARIAKFSKFEPWDHQLKAVAIVEKLEASYMALDMGCGKTKVGYDSIGLDVNNQTTFNRTYLVICPKYIIDVWKNESFKHSTIPFVITIKADGLIDNRIEHIKNMKRYSEKSDNPLFIIINYDCIANENMQKLLLSMEYNTCILDEAHRIKSSKGKIAKFIRAKLSKKCKKRICLSGTPIANLPNDLWSQYYFLDKDIFGTSYYKFLNKFFLLNDYNQPIKVINEEELKRLMFSICYQVDSDDVQDLPEYTDIEITGSLSSKELAIYNQMEVLLYSEINDNIVTAANAAVKSVRLRQITSGFLPDEDSDRIEIANNVKPNLLKELLKDIPQDEQIVIFCFFHYDMDIIKKTCDSMDITNCEISGRIKSSHDALRAFGSPTVCLNNEKPTARVLIGQSSSASEGVDYTNSRTCIFYTPIYLPKDYKQCRKRLLRHGQKRSVIYYHLVVKRTIDRVVYNSLTRKIKIGDSILSYFKEKYQS